MVKLVPMTDSDFRKYMETAVEEYAQAHVKAGDCDAAEALRLARADYDSLLPDGLSTRGHHLFSIVSGDAPIGMAWFEFRQKEDRKSIYLYDFQIDEPQRGKGYGAAALREIERVAASMGAMRMNLNVMGWNQVARSLYEKAGFTIAGIGMTKKLS